MVCIIDDREDVWNYALNLVPVKPYVFFKNTGDINAPGGVQAKNDSNGWPRASMKVPIMEQNGTRTSVTGGDIDAPFPCVGKENGTGLLGWGETTEKKDVGKNEDSSGEPRVGGIKREEVLKSHGKDINDLQSGQVSSERWVSTMTTNIAVVGESEVSPVKVPDEGGMESRLERTLQKEMSTREEELCSLQGHAGVEEALQGATVQDAEESESFTGCDVQGDFLGGSSESKESPKGSVLGVTQEADDHEKGVDNAQETDLGRTDAGKGKGHDGAEKSDTEPENAVEGSRDKKRGSEGGEDVEDDDDYLLYLEEILRTIHRAYYDIFDQLQAQHSSEVPDLKHVIPYVRRKCLKGVHMVFSGMIPTNQEPEKSRIYQVARSLGAKVSCDLGPSITHLVAARPGTAKTNKARRMGGIHLVNPGWLWCCAERWEHVAEQLFPLAKVDSMLMTTRFLAPVERREPYPERSEEVQRVPPVAASVGTEAAPVYDAVTGKRIRPREAQENLATRDNLSNDARQGVNDGSLSERTNPHLSMSSDELKAMDREVEDACSEEDDDDSDEDSRPFVPRISDDESSAESLTGGECPKGWRKRKRGTDSMLDQPALGNEKGCADDLEGVYEDDEELPVPKFPRCRLPEDSNSSAGEEESSDDYDASVGSADEEMAAAVEREFLGL